MSTETSGANPSVLRVCAGVAIAMRPRQVTKNGLILVALFFTVNQWWDPDHVDDMVAIILKNLAAVGIFTLVSGAMYLINDISDVDADRAHPRKKKRPIAAGIVPVNLAIASAILAGVGGIALAFFLRTDFGYATVAYVVLMLAYNLVLKHEVILDVMAISAGFVIRAVAGSVAIDTSRIGGEVLDLTISPWLYLVTALGALFIAIAKRRSELVASGDQSAGQRATLGRYSVRMLDMMIAVVAPATLVAYSLYTFGGSSASTILPDNNAMMLTIPFVVYGLFRYLYFIYAHPTPMGESPEDILLKDRLLMLDVLGWLVTAAAILLYNS